MRRKAAAVLLSAALSGCTSFSGGPEGGGGSAPWSRNNGPAVVPGVKGPYGEDIVMAAPYNLAPPPNAYAARQMMNQNVPLTTFQMGNSQLGMPPGAPPMPPGMPAFLRGPAASSGFLPAGGVVPANMPMGGGVINANIPPGRMPAGGVLRAQFAHAASAGMQLQGQRTQIRFVRPSGMRISWFTQGHDGPTFSTSPIEAPGRYNFPQAAIYRLKLSNIEGRPGLEVYPTMEVVPSNPKTEAFLAHSAVPISFTDEDFKQIAEGNYVVKVIYLPDPQFQDVAGTGTDEILSTRLEPGANPIQEALRRGSILVVIRMGNVDQEAPNTPPLNAPAHQAGLPFAGPQMAGQPGAMSLPPLAPQTPYWATKTAGPNPTPFTLPGVSMPGVSMPGVSMPGVSMPGVSMPGVSMPGVPMPGLQVPPVTSK